MNSPASLDAGMEARVRQSFANQKFMATIGATMGHVEPGRVTIEIVPSPAVAQQHGYVHAGVITSIADSACGYAAYTLMPEDSDVLSVEFKVNLLRPATGERVVADARVIRSGRTITVCQADVFAVQGGEARQVAMLTGTMMRVQGSGEASG